MLQKKRFLLLKKKVEEKRRRKIADMFLSEIENVNDEIVNPDLDCIQDFKAYARKTTQHAVLRDQYVIKLINELRQNQRHHDIHCIARPEYLKTLIGFTLDQFSNLLVAVKDDIMDYHPQMPFTNTKGDSCRCSIRMRLFMVLYRLRHGCSFRHLQGLFGWSSAGLRNDYIDIINILYSRLHCMHEGT
jgi:hypothetical protein